MLPMAVRQIQHRKFMKNLKKFLKKRWFIIFLAIIAVALLLIKFFAKPIAPVAPIKQPKPTSSQPSKIYKPISEFGLMIGGEYLTINLNQNNFAQFPKTLSVFPISIKSIAAEKALLAKYLGRVNFISTINQIVFSGKYSLANKKIAYQDAEALVQEKLTLWGLVDQDSIPTIKGYSAFGLELLPVADSSSAQIWKVAFEQQINGYPLKSLSIQENITEAQINTSGQLINLVSYLFEPDETKKTDIPLKTSDKVIEELEQGQGEFFITINSQGEQFSPPPMNIIKSITVDDVSLAYFIGVKNQQEYRPFFVFRGNLFYQTGESIQAILILPATEDQP